MAYAENAIMERYTKKRLKVLQNEGQMYQDFVLIHQLISITIIIAPCTFELSLVNEFPDTPKNHHMSYEASYNTMADMTGYHTIKYITI